MFRDVIGQSEVKARLIESVREGYIPHAQIFCGADGVGKLPLALAYAQYLNCENPQSDDACGRCASCVKYAHLTHPDLHFAFPITKKEKRVVCDDYLAEWRELILQESAYFAYNQWLAASDAGNSQAVIYTRESDEIIRKLNYKIYEGRYKVMLVWMPEKMNVETANKLLKIIEEPTHDTVFILVSANPEQVLPTIQSRCQRVNVRPIAVKDLQQALSTHFQLGAQAAAEVAHIARGSYVRALETIRTNDEQHFFLDLFKAMMRASYRRNIKEIKAISEELSKVGRERQKGYLDYCQRMVREYFVNNARLPELVYMNAEEALFGENFSPFMHERNILDFMEELELATRHIEQNVNPKMVFYDLCLQITMLIKR